MNEYFLADFRREARLAPKLEHPNIIPIRDASFIDGHFVISMPLGECTLGDRMRKRLATSTALDYAEQSLAALAHAHECKVIHCDVKPDNFVLFADNTLCLGDFGFSKIAQRTLKQASGSGTVGYMAPEQAVGRPMFQSDVFALGLLIYELFSGHLPQWPYDWPPRRIERVRAKLNPALVEWLRKAVQVRPQARYKNAIVMYREFKRARNGAGKRRKTRTGDGNRSGALGRPSVFESFRRNIVNRWRRTIIARAAKAPSPRPCRAARGAAISSRLRGSRRAFRRLARVVAAA